MPVLMFLRQYGLREYAITLTVAALVGLGVAVLLNSAPGGTAGSAELKVNPTVTTAASASPTPVVSKPVAKVRPVAKSHPVKPRHRAVRHHVRRDAAAPAPAPVRAPAPSSGQKLVAHRTPPPAPRPTYSPPPKPAPVVSKPAPKPRPAPKRGGGGSGQFDDSG